VKFRDEPRPRGGLLRCREFLMKDAYSFDVDEEGAKKSYETMRVAYTRIFDRLKLDYRMVQADSGAIGGKTSAEFQVLVDSGEDAIVACDTCSYAANVEAATVMATAPETDAELPREKVHTPGAKTIVEVTKLLGVTPQKMLKSLLYAMGSDGTSAAEPRRGPHQGLVMVVVRGDHEVNPVLVARAVGVEEVFLATEADVKKATGADVGFAGPVGFKGKVLVDRTASGVKNGVTGANETDQHLKNVNLGRDYEATVIDVRLATTGDTCPECGKGKLQSYKGIEGGHIFILGTRYSAAMGATYLDEQQNKKPIVMGCYGIGVSRLVATTIEQHHDENGIRWPVTIAPYHVHLVTLGKEAEVADAAEKLYADLTARGVEVLWDDRDERPGVKFKDADLIGLPLRVTIGSKGLAGGNVEVKPRTEADPKKAELVPLAGAAERVAGWVKQGLSS
jgi:prolyl-tRNA synthetase